MPSSTTAPRVLADSRSSVSGRPIALLRLPSVASTASRAEMRAQDRRGHLLDGRLAVAADDDGERERRTARASARRGARAPRADRAPRCSAPARGTSAARRRDDQRRGRALRQRRGDEVVAVEALAGSATNRSPGAQLAAVGRHAQEAHVGADGTAGDGRARPSPCPSCGAPAARARRPLRVASENGVRLPCAPGTSRGPCRRSARCRSPSRTRSRCAMAACAVELDASTGDGRHRGRRARSASAIAAGSSLRGLSLVTTTRSASAAAIAPICGRLPGSRSPPQPNTQTSSPPRRHAPGRSAVSTFSSASGVCA